MCIRANRLFIVYCSRGRWLKAYSFKSRKITALRTLLRASTPFKILELHQESNTAHGCKELLPG
jgi:hypothetical protein